MRNDERLRTIYEVMAPYIVRNEHNWRDYLAFASQFHKHSFDNILLVYAQDEDVSILATRKQWAAIGRNLIPRAKGVAVCVYRNAKLTLDYLFDVSQTTGKEIHPTDWQLSDEMKKALTERLSYAHGFPKQDFPQALYAMASESVAENYNHFLQELKQETKGHLFTEIPAGGFEAQYIQLLTDSISYFIGKKCHLPDEEIQLSDGMATVSHFNTLPLVAHLGTAVTALSKGILLEVERNIKIINRERMAQHEQTEYQSEIQGAGRDDASRSANLQQQRSRSTSGQVRPDGPGIPQRESPGAIYDFENGWQSDGDHAPGTGRGDREDRSPDAANAPAGAASADRGHHGADATPEQSETDGGGNRTPERSPDSPLTEEQPNTEVAPSAAPVGEPSEKDGSFSVPAEQPTRHFTDAEVRRNYEYILTSTNLYPPELHSAVRSVLSEPPLNPDWSDKGRQIAALFTPYGDREYQGDLLYRTRLHGEDGISFFFNEGYTYIPWNGLAFLLDAMIEDGDYPNPVVEEQPDPIGDYNIPDEVDEMGGPHRQMTIGEADFDYVLDAVAYEAGETVVEPVKPQAIVQMENDTPAAGDEPASVPDENPPVVVEAPETALPTDTAEHPTPPPVKGNTTAHKNFRRFQELFPEIVSGQYEYLRLEAGEAYYPLVIHHKYGSHYCMEHSAVGYLFREGAFLPAQETKPVRNEFGLDLFQHRGSVYEGKTGLQFCSLQQAEDLAGFVEKHGGIEKVQKLIADSLERTGLSPRYTRPDEKKKDIFPPKEKDENRVFAKDLMGNKHYYYRFYNENGIELYTMEKKREFFQTVYIPCDGFMVGIDQRHRLEEVLKWLPTLEHGIRGEIERVFNQSMEAPDRWADLGFANLLGRYEEAKAHNAPIAAERQRQADERRAQQDAREQQLAQERQARYDSAIREAEGNIMAGKEVINREINGKSLIMQLFREHEIPVPLKTQGWIINSLHSIRYDPQIGEWNYRYFKGSRDSTKMFDLLAKLSAAIQTRQQFEEHGESPPDTPVLDCEEEQDMEL